MRAPHVLRIPVDRLLHPERRVARAHGMILVGQRRAEQRHDAVAHDLVDGALVAVDRLHHPLEHRVEELPRLLGIAVGEQLHRALEVGEQHRDLLALALQGALGGEDLLGEVLGRVAGRAQRALGSVPRQRGPAGTAEPLPRADLGPALRTGQRETSAALLAESRVLGVLRPTLGAGHDRGGSLPPCSLALPPSGRIGNVKLNVDPWPT